MGFKYGTKDKKTHDIFLMLCMARYKAVFVFVGDTMLITLSGWNQSLLSDRHWRDALDFCNLPGCEQLVRCSTHIAGNILDLVMTDVPDIVDVVFGTSLGAPDHCFVSCASC